MVSATASGKEANFLTAGRFLGPLYMCVKDKKFLMASSPNRDICPKIPRRQDWLFAAQCSALQLYCEELVLPSYYGNLLHHHQIGLCWPRLLGSGSIQYGGSGGQWGTGESGRYVMC